MGKVGWVLLSVVVGRAMVRGGDLSMLETQGHRGKLAARSSPGGDAHVQPEDRRGSRSESGQRAEDVEREPRPEAFNVRDHRLMSYADRVRVFGAPRCGHTMDTVQQGSSVSYLFHMIARMFAGASIEDLNRAYGFDFRAMGSADHMTRLQQLVGMFIMMRHTDPDLASWHLPAEPGIEAIPFDAQWHVSTAWQDLVMDFDLELYGISDVSVTGRSLTTQIQTDILAYQRRQRPLQSSVSTGRARTGQSGRGSRQPSSSRQTRYTPSQHTRMTWDERVAAFGQPRNDGPCRLGPDPPQNVDYSSTVSYMFFLAVAHLEGHFDGQVSEWGYGLRAIGEWESFVQFAGLVRAHAGGGAASVPFDQEWHVSTVWQNGLLNTNDAVRGLAEDIQSAIAFNYNPIYSM